MDNHRFDELTKAFGSGASRRSLFRAALSSLAGAGLGALGLGAAEASQCRSAGNSCNANGDCCTGLCVTESRTRKICQCRQDGDCPPPPNECFDARVCAGGICAVSGYRGEGAVCSTGVCHDQACCTPVADEVTCGGGCGVKTNNCGQPVQCLLLPDDACVIDNDCCSGVCVDSVCQAGQVQTGGACDTDGDCVTLQCCANVCRDFTNDPANCGGCGSVCSSSNIPTPTCASGICDGACADGFADCDGDKLLNGCEVDIRSATDHCGSCDISCGGGEICVDRVCVCPSGQKLCVDVCIFNALCCTDADCADDNLCTDDVCDPIAHTCSNPATVCPFDPNHKGNPCWTTVCTDPAIGCQSVTVPDGTNMPACDSLGFTSSVEFCYGGNCCLAGAGNYACFADGACCPGYHCVCDPDIGCLNNSGQCELCKADEAACAQNHECCNESCSGGVCGAP